DGVLDGGRAVFPPQKVDDAAAQTCEPDVCPFWSRGKDGPRDGGRARGAPRAVRKDCAGGRPQSGDGGRASLRAEGGGTSLPLRAQPVHRGAVPAFRADHFPSAAWQSSARTPGFAPHPHGWFTFVVDPEPPGGQRPMDVGGTASPGREPERMAGQGEEMV